ncbi:hypothetical protein ASE27_10335 [Oerskovia sp. Root918]|uniref:hypothetical protein n=1 Tax=Oerskovia sp. Root918 TaxID=1736607 RepID=UPI0006F970A9|nr:hypothetical protein [Oerskovia sp. Root918]KRD36845.1 hypothetical protein ASE27_10335 [Oerskovia sp. Root918]
MTKPRELKPVGYQLWFALGALLLGILLALAQVETLPFLLFVLAFIWGVIGITRAMKIHRYVTRRSSVD